MKADQALYVIHRQKALAEGFSHDDFTAYIDMLGAWLASFGVKDFSYGSAKNHESREVFSDCIAIFINLPNELPDEIETVLGAMEMNQGLGAFGPLALHLQDRSMTKVALKAWATRQEYHREKMKHIADAASTMMRATRGEIVTGGKIGN